jgi:predicted DNA-binding transcriptional regulator AlpA
VKPKLVCKPEVLDRCGVAYVTLWGWMQQGKFPRSRVVGREIFWVESEIDQWILSRPIAPLKGDKVKPRIKQRA